MRSPLVRARVAALATIVVTTGALVTFAGPSNALAATQRAAAQQAVVHRAVVHQPAVAGAASRVNPAVDRCPAGSDYIDLNGMQIRSKVVDITNPAPNLQHGEVVCGEHVYRLERTKSGSTWQEWHTY